MPSYGGGTFLRYRGLGMDLRVVEGHVAALFFYFLPTEGRPFTGRTDRGIDALSSAGDVLRAYGNPRYEGASQVSEFGDMPGAWERSFEYDGIIFTFEDERLADVRVVRPRRP
jgi:hypothetical protein